MARNDPSSLQRKFEVIDTPGHGKLRHYALSNLGSSTTLKGLIFMVDSAALSSAAGLTEAATFLHDILLDLQKRHTSAKTSKHAALPVLVAANKQDLFTALPAQLVKKNLEQEITKIRSTRAKGLLDSGTGAEDEEREWLGEGGEGNFEFRQMEEVGVQVEVVGGNVRAEDNEGPHVTNWYTWIGSNL
ncbi:hypothetical protein H2203_005094 [Taxawa tesnikishii (nom. ined.)]|nr:hypothetical protein H2203_005094 [Dothideales sp. JES 119]